VGSQSLQDLDDLQNDSCTRARISRAKGPPMLGTDGYVEAGQTFERNPDYAEVLVDNVPVVDGEVEFGPFDWELRLQVLDADLNLSLTDAYAHYTISEEGVGFGYMGGGLELNYLTDFLSQIKSDATVVPPSLARPANASTSAGAAACSTSKTSRSASSTPRSSRRGCESRPEVVPSGA